MWARTSPVPSSPAAGGLRRNGQRIGKSDTTQNDQEEEEKLIGSKSLVLPHLLKI